MQQQHMNGKAAAKTAKDLQSSVTEIASSIAQEGYDMVAERARLVADTAEKAYDTGVDFVKKNPGKALIGSAVVGFLAALWFRRK